MQDNSKINGQEFFYIAAVEYKAIMGSKDDNAQ